MTTSQDTTERDADVVNPLIKATIACLDTLAAEVHNLCRRMNDAEREVHNLRRRTSLQEARMTDAERMGQRLLGRTDVMIAPDKYTTQDQDQ